MVTRHYHGVCRVSKRRREVRIVIGRPVMARMPLPDDPGCVARFLQHLG